MNTLTEPELIAIVERALELEAGTIDRKSTVDDVEGWDSLGHLNVLTELDRKLDGRASSITGLADASSVEEILRLLREHL